MDKFILNTKFEDNSSTEFSNYFDKLNKLIIENPTENYLMDVLDAICIQILKYNPEHSSNNSNMLIRCMVVFNDMAKNSVTNLIEDKLINAMKITINSDWTATKCELLNLMYKCLPENYFPNLSGKQLENHFALFKDINLVISQFEKPEKYQYIRQEQRTFTTNMLKYIDKAIIEKNIEQSQDLLQNLYFQGWRKNNEETEIISNLLYRSMDNYKTLYLTTPNEFLKLLTEVTEKLIRDHIETEKGKEIIKDFFSLNSKVLNHSKENIQLMMDKLAKSLFLLYKLDQDWMYSILFNISREFYHVESKFVATAFKKCEYLAKDAIEYFDKLIEKIPVKTEMDESTYEKRFSDWCYCVKSITQVFLQETLKTQENLEMFILCMVKFISNFNSEIATLFHNSFDKIEKPVQELFKNKPDLIIPLIDKCIEFSFREASTEDVNLKFPFHIQTFRLQDVFEKITKFGKLSKAFKSASVQNNLRMHFLKCFNEFNLTITIFIGAFYQSIEFQNYTPDQLLEFVQSMNVMIATELFQIYNPSTIIIGTLFGNIADYIRQSSVKYSSVFPELVNSCHICLKNGLLWESNDGELSFNTNSMIIFHISNQLLSKKSSIPLINEFYSILFEAINMTDESHGFYSSFIAYASSVPRQCLNPELLTDNMGNIINVITKLQDTSLDANIYTFVDGLLVIITSKPESGLEYLPKIENFLLMFDNPTYLIPIISILAIIYKNYPEKINTKLIEILGNKFPADLSNAYNIGNLLNIISKTHPNDLKTIIDQITEALGTHKINVSHLVMEIFANILKCDPSLGEKIFPIIVNLFESNKQDNNFCSSLLTGLRSLGLLRHDLLVGLKGKIEVWQTSNTGYHDLCQHLLDVIADRSLMKFESDIHEQKETIEKLDINLQKEKGRVDDISIDVTNQKIIVEDVSKRLENNEVLVEELKTEVSDVKEKVVEIDLKTVSSAPIWAREVSLLLNPIGNEDWRLLASRLGFSVDDIRSWSTHADPCMSLLSDFFSVRKKIEATRAILEQLIEINRIDAAEIVEKALTVSESMVPDEDPIEFITPPPVFLSYQWGIQDDVKVLRGHLQKAGYRCWMDIGQMGGGDKLYEAIDRGIRGAVVFISCVTKKYSESPNCKRELNLAISLHKSVIPLQMERMEWPPVGTMGPLLTEYIFIRMFSKIGTEIVSGTFWSKDKFQELLIQIRYSSSPEYEIVDNMYHNWWEPPEIKSEYHYKDKKVVSEISMKPFIDEKVEIENPEIFLSYQWDKQEEVKKLKEALTKMGYSCWMDIYQMGGGDSLYDKIDKGIRGCSIMISCVTPKYAESSNCRRELSLCDSLKKPLIPIMMERMAWPPDGPMSMILSQLLYISFVDTYEEQQAWNGQATKELLLKIQQIIRKPVNEIQNNILKETQSSLSRPMISENCTIQAAHVSSVYNTNTLNLPLAKSKSCIII